MFELILEIAAGIWVGLFLIGFIRELMDWIG